MQPTLSKKAPFNTLLVFPQILALSNYDSLCNFLSLPPFSLFYKNYLPLPHKKNNNQSFSHTPRLYQLCLSFPIDLEGASNLLFSACHRVEEENKAKTRVFSKESLEVEHSFSKEHSDIDDLSSKDEDH